MKYRGVNYSVHPGSSAPQIGGPLTGGTIQWCKKQGICGKKLNTIEVTNCTLLGDHQLWPRRGEHQECSSASARGGNSALREGRMGLPEMDSHRLGMCCMCHY